MIFLLFSPIFLSMVTQRFCFSLPPNPTESLINDVREIKESVFHLNKVLEKVLTRMNTVENDTQNILNEKFESQNAYIEKLIENCSKSKEINESITVTGKTQEDSLKDLILSNSVDYTLCNSVKNLSGVFKFYTSLTNLIDATRHYGLRLCQEGWLVIQKRDTFDYQENFNRSWEDYKYGFGDVHTEFWLGNNFLHQLSHQNDLKLRIELEDFDGAKTWAEYETFKVANEHEKYRLEIGGYSGTASDSFSYHNNAIFSTIDSYDKKQSHPCAEYSGSGWWFQNCLYVNLNGIYYKKGARSESIYKGIIWHGWLPFYSLKSTKMMVKPKGNLTPFSDLTYEIIH